MLVVSCDELFMNDEAHARPTHARLRCLTLVCGVFFDYERKQKKKRKQQGERREDFSFIRVVGCCRVAATFY